MTRLAAASAPPHHLNSLLLLRWCSTAAAQCDMKLHENACTRSCRPVRWCCITLLNSARFMSGSAMNLQAFVGQRGAPQVSSTRGSHALLSCPTQEWKTEQ